MIARALAAIPEGGRWARPLQDAIARGTLPAVHEMLMRSDPEYAATVEATERAGEQASTDDQAALLSDAPVDVAAEPEGFVPDDEVIDVQTEPEGFIPDEE